MTVTRAEPSVILFTGLLRVRKNIFVSCWEAENFVLLSSFATEFCTGILILRHWHLLSDRKCSSVHSKMKVKIKNIKKRFETLKTKKLSSLVLLCHNSTKCKKSQNTIFYLSLFAFSSNIISGNCKLLRTLTGGVHSAPYLSVVWKINLEKKLSKEILTNKIKVALQQNLDFRIHRLMSTEK